MPSASAAAPARTPSPASAPCPKPTANIATATAEPRSSAPSAGARWPSTGPKAHSTAPPAASASSAAPSLVGRKAKSTRMPTAGAAAAIRIILRVAVSGVNGKPATKYTVVKNAAVVARPPSLSGRKARATISPARNGAAPACTAGLESSSFILVSTATYPDHALQVAHQSECTLELREIGDIEGEAHEGELVPVLRASGGDIDLLARQRVADVAQQAAPVGGGDHHLDGVAALALAPLRLDEPLGLPLGEPLQARAILAVHGDALAARDEAADRIRRHRLAAARELGHQALHAADDEDALLRRLGFLLDLLRLRRFLLAAHCGLKLPQVDLFLGDGGKQLVRLPETEPGRERFQVGGRLLPAQLLLDDRTAGSQRLHRILRVEPLADLGASALALREAAFGVEPVPRRPAALRRDDLDALAVGERRVERDDLAVDARAAAAMAQIRVQRVGEVDRRRPRRQVDHLALRRQHVDGVVELRVLHARAPVGDFVAPREQLAQVGDLLLEALRGLDVFLVLPMRGDAVFRLAVHRLGADLHLERLPGRTDHRGMQRLVEVVLRARDVVVELARDR